MPEAERAKLRMMAVSYVNELYGDEAAKRRARVKARFVNNAMMVTLLGAVVSDALEDGRVVSGVGGQYNFVAQALRAAGRPLGHHPALDAHSARQDRVSNIRWNYGHTTIPRHLRDIVVTEYGVADLRGKSDRDVIAAMLAVTDSRFQGELLRQAKEAGKIESSYELPAACRDNTPDRIARALKPATEQGLLPPFPFGTDFTPVEQRLMPALETLRDALAAGNWQGWRCAGCSPRSPRRTCATVSSAWRSIGRPGARAALRGAGARRARLSGLDEHAAVMSFKRHRKRSRLRALLYRSPESNVRPE